MIDGAARPYRSPGRGADYFTRGKLAGDPIFAMLLGGGAITILSNARAALSARGRRLRRIGDGSAGVAHDGSTWIDRLVRRAKGQGGVRLCCRSLGGWTDALEQLGFAVDARPMSAVAPFANVLLVASPR